MKIIEMKAIVALTAFLLLAGCSETLNESILGTWQCPHSTLTLSDGNSWTVNSDAGGNLTTSSGTYSLASPSDWAGQIEGITQYPFNEFQYLKSKPLSETVTSMSGLILYRRVGGELVQCKRVR